MWKKYPRITAADEPRMALARARSLSAATLLSPMKVASLGSLMPRASTFRPRRSMNPSSEFSSGSDEGDVEADHLRAVPRQGGGSARRSSTGARASAPPRRGSPRRSPPSPPSARVTGARGRRSGGRRSSAPRGRGGERRARRARGRRRWRRASGTPGQSRRVIGARTSSTRLGREPGRGGIPAYFFFSVRASPALLSSSSTIRTKTSRGCAPVSGRPLMKKAGVPLRPSWAPSSTSRCTAGCVDAARQAALERHEVEPNLSGRAV